MASNAGERPRRIAALFARRDSRAARGGGGGDVDPRDVDGHFRLEGERAAERLVTIGAGTELVVEVRDAGERDLVGLGELAQEMEQRHRIAAPRHGGHDAGARRPQPLAANESANPRREIGHRDVGLVIRLRTCELRRISRRQSRARLVEARHRPQGLPAEARRGRAKAGAGGRTRTADPALMRRMLNRLSYSGTNLRVFIIFRRALLNNSRGRAAES